MSSTGVGFSYETSGGGEVEWYTPPEIFAMIGLNFDLDPCAPLGGPWHVPRREPFFYFTQKENGLLKAWYGRVWLNPPYGVDLPRWLSRLADHGSGIALVPARTDTEWFHRYAAKADSIAFLRQRVRFLRPDHTRGDSPGAGSMLVGYGDDCAEALETCPRATVVTPVKHYELPDQPNIFEIDYPVAREAWIGPNEKAES